jgi:pilus assembly protein CpaC
MVPNPYIRHGMVWSTSLQRLAFGLLLFLLWPTGQVSAQPPPRLPSISGFTSCLPATPEKLPRPASGKESVSAFVDSLSNNDSAFEVVVGQGRILTLKENLTGKEPERIAVGDPSVIDPFVLSERQIRITGRRIGVTDLSIITSDARTYNFEVRVVADLNVLRGQLHCIFPDASLRLAQIRDHIVVEGEARDTAQVTRIMETIRAYLASVQISQLQRIASQQGSIPRAGEGVPPGEGAVPPPETGGALNIQATVARPQIINLIRVPGSQQVLLKVRVAELNRTALRQIGGDFLSIDSDTGAIVGTQIGGTGVSATAVAAGRMLSGAATDALTATNTVFGIFQEGEFALFLSALRRNSLLKILAEPNLMALNGHQASFLAGGEFPVPVAQTSSGGATPAITVQFQEFGVRLGFIPYILDNDVIRLTVDPEVSTIDFALGTVLVPGGTPVPGLDTRKAHTVVELRQGQTLAIAGLMQLTLDGQTSRIPGLGDLPFIGPFFSNTTNTRTEKELVVLVTPVLVEAMNHDQVPPGPGDEVNEPNDLEFYLLNRIEGRTGKDGRSTTHYDDALHVLRCFMKLENEHVHGPHGFCD